MKVVLIRPALEMESAALQFRAEFFSHGETVINGSELFDQTDSYADWLQAVTRNADPETVDPNWVQTDTFFALDETGKIVGIIDFRHTLKGFLNDLGHCGFSVRPSERGKGFAAEMLRQVCAIAREAGLSALQLSAERGNAASVKTIERCGGRRVRSFLHAGEEADVFRIPLS